MRCMKTRNEEGDKLPFEEEILGDELYERVFSETTPSEEFMWHRDKEDRTISPTHETDWGFQIEDELPLRITKDVYVPKETYHRLIKGTGDLVLRIKKHV